MTKKIILFSIAFFCFFTAISQNSKKITPEDIWRLYSFYPKSIDGLKSMNDGLHYSVLENNSKSIVQYSYETGEKISTIFSLDFLSSGIDRISSAYSSYDMSYEFSKDETKIIFLTDRERIYRRSWTGEYYVWDIVNKKLTRVSTNGRQQMATLSPDGYKVAFVRENNIYIKDLQTDKEYAITTDGKHNHIINGIPDWVYEEEFSFNQAFEWSPDGKSIAYYKFDESHVKLFGLTFYKGLHPEKKENKLYPEYRTFKYPKAGEKNSIVSIHIYNLNNKSTKLLDTGKETDQYIPRIKWTTNSSILSIMRLNRLQNKLEILLTDKETGVSKVIYSEENKYYISEEHFDNLKFLDDGKHFVITNESDGYSHIYLYQMNGTLVRQITKGNWDVMKFHGYDTDKELFYYISTEESPLQRNLYSIKLNGKSKKKISAQNGRNDITFSSGFKFFINDYSNANKPNFITLNLADGKQIRILEDNASLSKKIETFGFTPKEFFTFEHTDTITLNGWMIKPPDFDDKKKYPVFITQYSGPNSQEVLDEWSTSSMPWHQMLAQKGYIVVCVDVRGTGGRGEEFRKMTYLQMGKYETIDLIETAKYLGSLSYIDANRIGIYGWSYGAYISSLCMTKGADYFKMGIAVAPVTNWRYYDNIYTERYMRTPQENPLGYDDNSPTNHAIKLKGKFLLIHGMADDNVHIQNSTEFAEALVQANKQFDMHYYTNRNHSIYGGNTRFHLFSKMTKFIEKNL